MTQTSILPAMETTKEREQKVASSFTELHKLKKDALDAGNSLLCKNHWYRNLETWKVNQQFKS
jgi:hypothetical protein